MNTKIEQMESVQKTITLVLGGILAVLLCLYAFFVSGAIRNVVVRERLASDTAALHTAVSVSEQRYVALKDSITSDVASSLGFVQSGTTVFVSTAGEGRKISFNTR